MSICSFRGIVVIDIEYDYDSEGRVTKEQYTSNGTTVTVKYVYDGLGRLVSVNDGFTGRTTNYSYDADGRLLCVETKQGNAVYLSVRYQYDVFNRVIGQSTSLRTTTTSGVEMTPVEAAYVYNTQQRLGQITAGNIRQNAAYNANGTLATLQTGTPNTSGGIATTVKSDAYTYDGADASLKQHTVSVLGSTAYTYSYEYDSRGNITKITRANGGSSKSINYTYDAANQLVREDNQIAGYTWVMTYDDAGNMLTRKKYSYTTGTLGSVLSTQTFTYGKDGWGDVLTKINSTTVTSDASGNLLSDGTNTYTWKNGRQLATVTRNGATWTNTYDANGMRTQRVSGSTVYAYIYDGGNLSQMTVGSNALIFTYGINGQPMSVKYNGVDYYYVTNSQGDVVGILNGSGVEVVSYVYDAWGNIISFSGAMAGTLGFYNPFRYRGYVYDQETGLYYLQSRYYNPAICRFISADSISYLGADGTLTSYNLFAYCLNNPINYIDKSGTSAEALQWWTSGMWWLAFVDTVLPFGDIIYIGGILLFAVIALASNPDYVSEISYDGVDIAPNPPSPNGDDDDDDDDYYDDDSNFGGRQKIGRSNGNTPGSNRAQNKQFRDATNGLTPDQQRIVHNKITKKGLGYHDIKVVIKDLFIFVIGLSAFEE